MGLRTGQVAAAAGVNVETLRYYERRGILAEPKRRVSGYREYPEEAVRIVRFIKGSQALGFSLEEIRELLELRRSPARSCNRVKLAAEDKIAEIDSRLSSLRAMKRALGKLVSACGARTGTLLCPILETLDDRNGGA